MRLWLQISFDTVQWKKSEGKIVNQSAFRPSYSQLKERMLKNEPGSKLSVKYSEKLQNPWVTYYNESDGTDNIIWYEDSRSVQAKLTLAKMFGIKGISLWRLGNIPDYENTAANETNLNVWQMIKANLK
jgi:spore germination protein YaaH